MNQPVPPAAVRGNDWRSLPVRPADAFVPERPVSVVITYFEAPDALALTLAALEMQTYPRDLIEIVIVDDGSREPLQTPSPTPLDIRVVHQEDLGFGLARARNTGVRAASHDIIVFLDCDMMPEAGWLAEHARWHHAASDVLTLGFRAHVDVAGIDAGGVRNREGSLSELFTGRAVDTPEWIEFHMARTDELTSDADDLFRVVTGGNLGVSRSFFELVGGYDETFTQWGCEDTEFGYRAFTRGGVLVPARDAMCWHQGPGAAPSSGEKASLELQRAKISHLIAHHGFRQAKPGRSFSVPQYLVTVVPGDADPETLLWTVERILGSTLHDLIVWVDESPRQGRGDDAGYERFRRLVAGDARVRLGPEGGAAEAFAAAAFHITVPAGADLAPDDLMRMARSLKSASQTQLNLSDGTSISLTRARLVHRAARTRVPCDPVGEATVDRLSVEQAHPIGGTQPRPATRVAPSRRRAAASNARDDRHQAAAARRIARPSVAARLDRVREMSRSLSRQALQVRSSRDAARLARAVGHWVGAALAWRVRWIAWKHRQAARWIMWRTLRAQSWARRTSRSTMWRTRRALGPSALGIRPAAYRLGPHLVARGPTASQIFEASSRVDDELGPAARVLLVDSELDVPPEADDAALRVVKMADLAPTAHVPAFDAEQVNPVNWTIDCRKTSAALGPVRLLPKELDIRKTANPDKILACRRFRHVVDTAAFHESTRRRAASLATLAACGVVIHMIDEDPKLREMLGPDLYALMRDPAIPELSEQQRESHSIATRREALRNHSLRARARQVLAAAELEAPPLPRVSVLLATCRPSLVDTAITSVAIQTYPHVELVLALHGEGFDHDEIDILRQRLPFSSKTVVVPRSAPLGTVLNEAVAASSGDLITKFDDDDLYGPEHLWDLVLAHEYSGACLVGKAAEYVYLERSNRTIQRFRGGAERLSSELSLAGGAMMISRSDLDAILGWQEIPSGVDKALIDDVAASGRRLYRTHGKGYVLVRHGDSHTWGVDDAYFEEQAQEIRDGRDLAFAGL